VSEKREVLTLAFVKTTLRLIEKSCGKKLELGKIPLNDAKTYNLLKTGNVEEIFLSKLRGMEEFLKLLKPDNFSDLVAIFALYRPAPFEAGIVEQFLEAKHKKLKNSILEKEVEALVSPILGETYGILLYHEQVIKIIQKVAEYNLSEAKTLRKLLSKKDIQALVIQKQKFTYQAKLKGFSELQAEKIFKFLQEFTPYTFSKKHAVFLALKLYYIAYLKAHYPLCFKKALSIFKS